MNHTIASRSAVSKTAGVKTGVPGNSLLRWSAMFLVATVWLSATLFGLYILAFYAAALFEGNMEQGTGFYPACTIPERDRQHWV